MTDNAADRLKVQVYCMRMLDEADRVRADKICAGIEQLRRVIDKLVRQRKARNQKHATEMDKARREKDYARQRELRTLARANQADEALADLAAMTGRWKEAADDASDFADSLMTAEAAHDRAVADLAQKNKDLSSMINRQITIKAESDAHLAACVELQDRALVAERDLAAMTKERDEVKQCASDAFAAWKEADRHRESIKAALAAMQRRAEEAEALINTPEIHDFAKAVTLEAAHQRKRWAADGDDGKTNADWFWLIGYLAGKALHNPGDDSDKRLHRVITVAAAACNWHAALMGSYAMRPGIAAPSEPSAALSAQTPAHGGDDEHPTGTGEQT